MNSASIGRGSGIVRDLWSRTVQWRPVLAGAALAFAVSGTFLQWARPFLDHDDWDLLLPNRVGFVSNHLTRVRFEGRWLTYWWWQVGAQHIGPVAAAVLFSLAWLLAAGILVRALSIGWWSVPAVVALFCAPMMSDLNGWPATMGAPTTALALTLAALWATRDHIRRHLTVLAIGVVITTLGYPPFALFVLSFLVVLHHRKPTKQLVVIGSVFTSTYIAGLLMAFTLNLAQFGVFGIDIQEWRHPTPLRDWHSLSAHLGLAFHGWGSLISLTGIPLIAVAVAMTTYVIEQSFRRRLAVLGIAFVIAAVLASTATITNGVFIPFRAMGWTWAFAVIALVWLLRAEHRSARVLAACGLTVVALWSALYCTYAAQARHDRAGWLHQLRHVIAVDAHNAPLDPVVFWARNASEKQSIWIVANALAKLDHVPRSTMCTDCTALERYAASHPSIPAIFSYNHTLVVRIPPEYLAGIAGPRPHPHWLIPFQPVAHGDAR